MRLSTLLLRILACTLLLALAATFAQAGKLSRTRDAVRSSTPAPAPAAAEEDDDNDGGKLSETRRQSRQERPRREPSREHRRRRDRHHHEHHYYGSGGLFAASVWNPCWANACPPPPPAPVYVIEQPQPTPGPVVYESASQSWGDEPFAAFPYADPRGGGLLAGSHTGKAWSGRLQIEGGGAGDGVDRTGVSFLLEESHGFGVDFEWDSFTEELPSGEHDELHLGELNLMYRLVETEHALVRAGVGVAWLGDRYATDTGANFTLQADLTPRKPWVLSVEADFGTLGDAERLDLSGTAGVALGRVELYGGYDYHRIGGVELQGPTAGVRLWW